VGEQKNKINRGKAPEGNDSLLNNLIILQLLLLIMQSITTKTTELIKRTIISEDVKPYI